MNGVFVEIDGEGIVKVVGICFSSQDELLQQLMDRYGPHTPLKEVLADFNNKGEVIIRPQEQTRS